MIGQVATRVAHAGDAVIQKKIGHPIRERVFVEKVDVHVPETGNEIAAARIQSLCRRRVTLGLSGDAVNPSVPDDHPLLGQNT